MEDIKTAVAASLADKPKLTDPWFNARLYVTCDDDKTMEFVTELDKAHGVMLWCPCGYGKAEYPCYTASLRAGPRPHAIFVPFSNPRTNRSVSDQYGPVSADGKRVRWQMSGTSLDDLTIEPSIAVRCDPPCWHGFIQQGRVVTPG
jgi:hypothetical protein